MKLIVGLGNPGGKYQETLHNVGFNAVDVLAQQIPSGSWVDKFKGKLLQGRIGQNAFLLLKPQTFMNLSGDSVLACKQFYKIELEDILVVFDDVDRPAGSLRYRTTGGHGGHNGMRDIIQKCGGNQFHRIKIGIGRPIGSKNVADYVLSKPPMELRTVVDEAVTETGRYLTDFINGQTIAIQPQSTKEEVSEDN